MPFDAKDYQYENYIVEEIEPGFIHVKLNNPKTLNAFTTKYWQDYEKIFTKLDQDEDTKVILLSSNFPRAFTSGLNLKEAALLAPTGNSEKEKYDKLYPHVIAFQKAVGVTARINTPTIALLNGVCYGLALDIAGAVTIRVATADAKLSIREIKIGIVADMGSLQRIPRLVGNASKIYQYALTGEVFSGNDAADIGLVSKVVPDYEAGLEYCIELGKDINSNVGWTIKGTKESIQQIVNGDHADKGLAHIAVENSINIPGLDRSKL